MLLNTFRNTPMGRRLVPETSVEKTLGRLDLACPATRVNPRLLSVVARDYNISAEAHSKGISLRGKDPKALEEAREYLETAIALDALGQIPHGGNALFALLLMRN